MRTPSRQNASHSEWTIGCQWAECPAGANALTRRSNISGGIVANRSASTWVGKSRTRSLAKIVVFPWRREQAPPEALHELGDEPAIAGKPVPANSVRPEVSRRMPATTSLSRRIEVGPQLLQPKNHMLPAKERRTLIQRRRIVSFGQRRVFISNSNPVTQCHEAIQSLAQRARL